MYCGEQFDGTTGLYYLRARYMNPNTGTFISMDSYSGSINDPVSLHKYLYANANPVMYSDPSGYSVENDLDFYQQAWLSIDQAIQYEQQLISSACNEAAYNVTVVRIGKEMIQQLGFTALEMALTNVLTPLVGPAAAKAIASGIVTALDLSLGARDKAVENSLSDTVMSERKNIAEYIGANMDDIGYLTKVYESPRSRNKAMIVAIENLKEKFGRIISQIQVSPRDTRHGNSPYIKISTSNKGKIKIVFGSPEDYNFAGETGIDQYFFINFV